MSAAIDHGYLPCEKYVINHDIMHCTAEGVVGNHLYSGRALGISEPSDLIQLHPDLQTLWRDITAHYARIGLSHSEQVIWNLDMRHLGSHIGYRPSVFYFGPNECRYWGDRAWLDSVEYINSKNNFMTLAERLGVDVPKTRCFDRAGDVGLDVMLELLFPCYLKAAVSVSGVGIYRCEDKDAFVEALSRFPEDVPVQVQEEVMTQCFLNLQYQVVGDEVFRLQASEQVLEGFAHQGNRAPVEHAPWEAVDAMANWLRDRGMHGIFAFDVAVVQSAEGVRYPAIECNPRFNGASYPTLIARKLDITEWSAITFSTRHRRLSDIGLEGIEFDTQRREGVIIVNWGTVLVGKLLVLIAGPRARQEALAVELASRL